LFFPGLEQKDDAVLAPNRLRTRLAFRFLFMATLSLFAAGPLGPSSYADVVHLINDSAQDDVTILNSGQAFVTDFKATNDVTVSMVSGTVLPDFLAHFPGPAAGAPSNNPAYITSFIGSASQGTGDGTPGGINELSPSIGNGVQFDFSIPLTSKDFFSVDDVDNSEIYTIKAFSKVGNVLTPVSLVGWTHNAYTGMTGQLPDAQWSVWNPIGGGPTTGTLTSSVNYDLNDPLDVLSPDQSISRIIITQTAGDGYASVQFISVAEPGPLALAAVAAVVTLSAAKVRRKQGAA
jgi:hypothetical protein